MCVSCHLVLTFGFFGRDVPVTSGPLDVVSKYTAAKGSTQALFSSRPQPGLQPTIIAMWRRNGVVRLRRQTAYADHGSPQADPVTKGSRHG